MVRYKNISYDDKGTPTNILSYAGGWFQGSFNASSVGTSGTLSTSSDPTANVTFNFPVAANAVYYYGIPRSRGALYAVCVDCYNNLPHFQTVDALNRSDDGTNPPIVLWSQTFTDVAVHSLILTNQNDTRVVPSGNSEITLDRFELQVVDDSDTGPNTTTQASTSSSSPTGFVVTPSPIPSLNSPSPNGAIVGGVVGAIIALTLCVVIWFLMRRRRRVSADPERRDTIAPEMGTYQSPPFTVISMDTCTTSNPSTDLLTFQTALSPTDTAPTSLGENKSSVVAPSSSASSRSQRRSRHHRRREMDAGPLEVETDDSEELETLPPEYGDIFNGGESNAAPSNSAPRREAPRPLPRPGHLPLPLPPPPKS